MNICIEFTHKNIHMTILLNVHIFICIGSAREGGFAAHDHMNEMWTKIEIPVLLVTFKTAGI